jgi:hypothetical protein
VGREYAPVPGKWYENREEEETFRVLSVDEERRPDLDDDPACTS